MYYKHYQSSLLLSPIAGIRGSPESRIITIDQIAGRSRIDPKRLIRKTGCSVIHHSYLL